MEIYNISFLLGAGCEVDYGLPNGNDFINTTFINHSAFFPEKVKENKKYTKEQLELLCNSIFDLSNKNKKARQDKLDKLSNDLEYCDRLQKYVYRKVFKDDRIPHDITKFDNKEVLNYLQENIEYSLNDIPILIYFMFSQFLNENKDEMQIVYKRISSMHPNFTYKNATIKNFQLFILHLISEVKSSADSSDMSSKHAEEIRYLITKYLSITTDYCDFLLDLMIRYVKNKDLSYFALSSSANDLLSKQLLISSNKIGLYDWINNMSFGNYNPSFSVNLKYAFTTNYTSLIDERCKNKFTNIYKLHGELNQYYDVNTKEFFDSKKEDTFPYLILQTSAKIIDEVDLLNGHVSMYDKLKDKNETSVLFIAGMGLNEDDNHILNSLIKLSYGCDNFYIVYLNYTKNGNSNDISNITKHFRNNFIEVEYDPIKLNSQTFNRFIIEKISEVDKIRRFQKTRP